MTIEVIIFYLLLLDAIIANIVSLWGQKRYIKHFRIVSRFLPLTKGRVLCYLVLVLYIGYLTFYS